MGRHVLGHPLHRIDFGSDRLGSERNRVEGAPSETVFQARERGGLGLTLDRLDTGAELGPADVKAGVEERGHGGGRDGGVGGSG